MAKQERFIQVGVTALRDAQPKKPLRKYGTPKEES